MKLGEQRIGNIRLIHLKGRDGIPNVKVELPKEEYQEGEVIGSPHYKPFPVIDHWDYKHKVGNKIKKIEGVPVGSFIFKFEVEFPQLNKYTLIPILRVRVSE